LIVTINTKKILIKRDIHLRIETHFAIISSNQIVLRKFRTSRETMCYAKKTETWSFAGIAKSSQRAHKFIFYRGMHNICIISAYFRRRFLDALVVRAFKIQQVFHKRT